MTLSIEIPLLSVAFTSLAVGLGAMSLRLRFTAAIHENRNANPGISRIREMRSRITRHDVSQCKYLKSARHTARCDPGEDPPGLSTPLCCAGEFVRINDATSRGGMPRLLYAGAAALNQNSQHNHKQDACGDPDHCDVIHFSVLLSFNL
jgi:hypothetical protein